MKVLIFLLSLIAGGCQTHHQFSEAMKGKILDDVKRDDISGRIHMLFREVENGNWEEARKIFAPEIEVDLGEGYKKMTPEEFLSIWKKSLEGVDGLHHQVSNYGIVVMDKEADLNFVSTVTHFKRGKNGGTKSFYGKYHVFMIQPEGDPTNWEWLITKFKYHNRFSGKSFR